ATSKNYKADKILEDTTAEALKGFDTKVFQNVRLETIDGGVTEVDVLALIQIGIGKVPMVVSSKNYANKVPLSVIKKDIKKIRRVKLLRNVPHIKLLVVSKIDEPARQIAEYNGFDVVEVGFQVTEENM
ncbi:MAG: hypothetical protein ACK4M3_07170, partial [Pyrobaculum sp.]